MSSKAQTVLVILRLTNTPPQRKLWFACLTFILPLSGKPWYNFDDQKDDLDEIKDDVGEIKCS